jgi:hypothetical protein
LPQLPQFSGSVRTSVHFILHIEAPRGQLLTQAPALQRASPLPEEEQACPQAPQWSTSVRVSTQAPSQALRPAAHLKPHTPAAHVAVALAGAVHRVEQEPQRWGSFWVSEQVPLQSVVGAGQVVAHFPSEQSAPGTHAFAQAPQFFPSVARFTQTPLHSAKPALQVDLQTPFSHAALAFAAAVQRVPQLPQLFGSRVRSRQRAPHAA